MKRFIYPLTALIFLAIQGFAQDKTSELKDLKYRLGKTIRIISSNECCIYMGYIMLAAENGKVTKAWYVKRPVVFPNLNIEVKNDSLMCRTKMFLLSETAYFQIGENISLEDFNKIIKQKKLDNITLKLPIIITSSSNRNYDATCEGKIDLQNFLYLMDQLSGNKKVIGEMLLPPMIFSRPASVR